MDIDHLPRYSRVASKQETTENVSMVPKSPYALHMCRALVLKSPLLFCAAQLYVEDSETLMNMDLHSQKNWSGSE